MDLRDAFFSRMYENLKDNDDFVILTVDVDAFMLSNFRKFFPDRIIDVGVSEQNAINVASGLARCGKRVFVYGLSPFIIMRAYEQIKVNLFDVPRVTIIGLGAGFSFSYDGHTHHSIHDTTIMRTLPNWSIYNISDTKSAYYVADQVTKFDGLSYVRLDKGSFDTVEGDIHWSGYRVVKPVSNDLNIITTGTMIHDVLHVLGDSNYSTVGVVEFLKIHPLDISDVFGCEVSFGTAIAVEESTDFGGIATRMRDQFYDFEHRPDIHNVCVTNSEYTRYGTREYLKTVSGVGKLQIKATIDYVMKKLAVIKRVR